MAEQTDILIVGAGIFGTTAAIEFASRGYQVILLDEVFHPHPLAASTDISKVVRAEYGRDRQYIEMALKSIDGFRTWNKAMDKNLFHETGICCFTIEEMSQGGFEYECYKTLRQMGVDVERLSKDDIARRFPAWNHDSFVDGTFNPVGGYVESGKMMAYLFEQVNQLSIRRIDSKLEHLTFSGMAVTGGTTRSGLNLVANHTLIAAGAWTPDFLPELKNILFSTGHPVFHLDVSDKPWFSPPHFATYMADIARSGWYGFPVHPTEGILKIGRHSNGVLINADAPERLVQQTDEEGLRAFLTMAFPSIADARIVYRRLCLYCDTESGDFLIDNHPERPGLSVASGGSGHGFKFAPILGRLIADSVERIPNEWLDRFKWREQDEDVLSKEASRHRSD